MRRQKDFVWQTEKRHGRAFLALALLVVVTVVVLGSGCEEATPRGQDTGAQAQDEKPKRLSKGGFFSLLNPPSIPGTAWQIVNIRVPFKVHDKLGSLWDTVDEEFVARDGRLQFNDNDIRIGVGKSAEVFRAIEELTGQGTIYNTKVISVRIPQGRSVLVSLDQTIKERTIMFSSASGSIDATDFPDGVMKIRISAREVSAEQFAVSLYPVVFFNKSKERKAFERVNTSLVLTPVESLVIGAIEGNPRLLGGFFVNDEGPSMETQREIILIITPQLPPPPQE